MMSITLSRRGFCVLSGGAPFLGRSTEAQARARPDEPDLLAMLVNSLNQRDGGGWRVATDKDFILIDRVRGAAP